MQDSKNGPTRTDPNSERKAESTGVVLPVADLRDYLAAKAMQGLYASGTQQVAMMSGDYDGATRDETVCNVNARMAFNAYRIADAMLAARKGPANG